MGKGGKKGGKVRGWSGKGKTRGSFDADAPLYATSKHHSIVPASRVASDEDAMLIVSHRRLLRSWRASPYYIKGREGSANAIYDKVKAREQATAQKDKLLVRGGVSLRYFPGELLLDEPLRIKGGVNKESLKEALDRIDEKEARRKTVKVKHGTGKGERANGEYEYLENLNGKATYRHKDGACIIYFSDGWKLNLVKNTNDYYFFHPSREVVPPDGTWHSRDGKTSATVKVVSDDREIDHNPEIGPDDDPIVENPSDDEDPYELGDDDAEAMAGYMDYEVGFD